ncbi:MAG: J domain-containing protein [Bacteroidetes bacterium]|nr:J domain-containing protein [Bacteroidota bacterium]
MIKLCIRGRALFLSALKNILNAFHMPLVDHYKALGVAPNATLTDIKNAYRSLALQYHPDKAQENPHALVRFQDIAEAYRILSNIQMRKRYDEQRYLAGITVNAQPESISGEYLLKQAVKMKNHLTQVDSDSINQKSLFEFLSLIFSDTHLAVLNHEHNNNLNHQLLHETLLSAHKLDRSYLAMLIPQLALFSANDSLMQSELKKFQQTHKHRSRNKLLRPVVWAVATILICLMMVWYVRHT